MFGFFMVDLTLVEVECSESASQQLWKYFHTLEVLGGCLEVPTQQVLFFSHLQKPNSIHLTNLFIYLIWH